MTELVSVRIETNRADPAIEAFVRAGTMLGFFYPAGLVGQGIAREGEEKGLQLKDGFRLFGGKSKSGYIFFRVYRDGTDLVQFSLNNYGLRALNIADTHGYKETYITRTMFADTGIYGQEIDRKFKGLAPDVVNWLGTSIFQDKLQPFPEQVSSQVDELLEQLK